MLLRLALLRAIVLAPVFSGAFTPWPQIHGEYTRCETGNQQNVADQEVRPPPATHSIVIYSVLEGGRNNACAQTA